jgi:hypothetical protein
MSQDENRSSKSTNLEWDKLRCGRGLGGLEWCIYSPGRTGLWSAGYYGSSHPCSGADSRLRRFSVQKLKVVCEQQVYTSEAS